MKYIFISKKNYNKIIGILNLTMDSFSDGGMYFDLKSAKRHVSEMIEQGTDVIDIEQNQLDLGSLM